jgi:hypothetical protein
MQYAIEDTIRRKRPAQRNRMFLSDVTCDTVQQSE